MVYIFLFEVLGRSDTEALLARFFSKVGIEIEIRMKTQVKNTVPIGPAQPPEKNTSRHTNAMIAVS